MFNRLSNIVLSLSLAVLGCAIYLASYSVYLRQYPTAEYVYWRSPAIYRPAEWAIVRTPLQRPLLKWSSVVGSRGQTELQCFFFAQGVADPLDRFHFNIQD